MIRWGQFLRRSPINSCCRSLFVQSHLPIPLCSFHSAFITAWIHDEAYERRWRDMRICMLLIWSTTFTSHQWTIDYTKESTDILFHKSMHTKLFMTLLRCSWSGWRERESKPHASLSICYSLWSCAKLSDRRWIYCIGCTHKICQSSFQWLQSSKNASIIATTLGRRRCSNRLHRFKDSW